MLFASQRQLGAGGRSYALRISANTRNFNLRTAVDALGYAGQAGVSVTLTIDEGVLVGSASTATPALATGSWPAGATLAITNRGRIAGCGGQGGGGGGQQSTGGHPGVAGGTAFTASAQCAFANLGILAGGGGGGGGGGNPSGNNGGGGGGGGGAGDAFGAAGGSGGHGSANGSAGTLTTGGAGGAGDNASAGGKGGDAGQAGAAGGGGGGGAGAGGAAGAAVTGNTLVTWTAEGTRLGTINS